MEGNENGGTAICMDCRLLALTRRAVTFVNGSKDLDLNILFDRTVQQFVGPTFFYYCCLHSWWAGYKLASWENEAFTVYRKKDLMLLQVME